MVIYNTSNILFYFNILCLYNIIFISLYLYILLINIKLLLIAYIIPYIILKSNKRGDFIIKAYNKLRLSVNKSKSKPLVK